jgi:hypothetical protein
MEYAFTEPLREFARRRGISPTRVYGWIESGDIESYVDGGRRYIVLASYDRLVQRLIQQSPAKVPSPTLKAKARKADIAQPEAAAEVSSPAPRRRGRPRATASEAHSR